MPQQQIWQKRILIPFWILEFGVLLLILGWAGYELRFADRGTGWTLNISSAIVVIIFFVISVALNIFEIVQFSRSRLSPIKSLAVAGTNTLLWMIVMIASFCGGLGGWGLIDFSYFSIAPFLTDLSRTIYASVMLYRQRKGLLYKNEEYDGNDMKPLERSGGSAAPSARAEEQPEEPSPTPSIGGKQSVREQV